LRTGANHHFTSGKTKKWRNLVSQWSYNQCHANSLTFTFLNPLSFLTVSLPFPHSPPNPLSMSNLTTRYPRFVTALSHPATATNQVLSPVNLDSAFSQTPYRLLRLPASRLLSCSSHLVPCFSVRYYVAIGTRETWAERETGETSQRYILDHSPQHWRFRGWPLFSCNFLVIFFYYCPFIYV